MAVSSARPDHLDAAADGLARASGRLLEVVDRAARALVAYERSCPDVPLAPVSPARAGGVAADARGVATNLRTVARAFRLADGDRPLARTTDVELALVLATRFRGVDDDLTGPALDGARRGHQVGRLVRAAAERGDPSAMARVLDQIDDGDAVDPLFAAALLAEVETPQLEAVVEHLAAVGEPAHPDRALSVLARLLAAAATTLDGPASVRLDPARITALTATAPGRAVLRVLLATHPGALPPQLVRLVAPALLLSHSFDGDAVPSALSAYLTRRGDDGDDPVVAVLARSPGALVALLTSRQVTFDVDERVRRLVTATSPAAAAELATLLRQVLGPTGPPTEHRGLRLAVLRGLVAGVGDVGVDAVREPLAQLLADTVATDPGFYVGRADVVDRPDLRAVLDAVTRYERPWLTALDGLRAETQRRILATLHEPLELRATALADLGELLDAFERAATRSDAPRDTRAAEFALASVAVRLGGDRLIGGFGPVVRLVAGTGIDRALDAWHRATMTDRGDRGPRTVRDREALRHRIWLVVAGDPTFAARLVWPPPSEGLRITSPAELGSLTGSDADVDDLAAWASRQPADLRALVATYVDSTR